MTGTKEGKKDKGTEEGTMDEETTDLVQYLIIRKDLGWPLGAMIAQGAHAAVAATEMFRDDLATRVYLESLETMHKIVLGIDGERQLTDLGEVLAAKDVKHYCWREQPENIPTVIALKPYNRKKVNSLFRKLKLLS
ncbi:peptidyl-tRNA hydrolase type 2 [Gregarina niphandrodes]|uniref:peptidyl-tRNA hydrolase n=1 Tax=Gregarina niphandrodes TaxID=110365 RepID=A0A023B0R1_GRENI|nr:peptidyl-tRNA hydrolase type 2 [Gregarina niphandrodes]EZG45803.1 peptidyl-tRNA hydrolase type 2 [Gregarina niphandrodes]|eukprot:XP_011132440.1 peptidyl-tRNA hydrolase type 2 [Gregarina niphandrodes]